MRTLRSWSTWSAVALLAPILLAWPSVAATPGSSATTSSAAIESPGPATSEAEIADRRARLDEERKELARVLETAPAERQLELREDAELLQSLDLVYNQQLEVVRHSVELAAARARIEQDQQALRQKGLGETPPYSFMMLDRLREQLRVQAERERTSEAAVRAAEEDLAVARAQAEAAEQRRRQAKEEHALARNTPLDGALEQALRRRQNESRLAAERVRLAELTLQNERTSREIARLQLQLLREQSAMVEGNVRFARKELNDQIGALDKQEADLTQALETARLELDAAERAWAKARQRLDRQPEEAATAAEVEARRTAFLTRQRAVSHLAQQLQYVATLKTIWNRRFAVANRRAGGGELDLWERETREAIEQLGRAERVEQSRLTEAREEAEAAAQSQRSGTETSRWTQERRSALEERVRLSENHLAALQAAARAARKLLDEIEAEQETIPWRQRLSGWWEARGRVWNYELFAVDDRPITAGKILTGLILLAAGILLSRRLSELLGRHLLPRFGLASGAASALQSLSFYLFIALFTLFALRVVNVPLTAFTLLGGALAIGLGFGSQNIVNNFISGLILLAEQPIRIGDLIEVDGTAGRVEHIGARSTRLRAAGNVDIVIPNSAFLEKTVVNWTLGDDEVRGSVRVGVAYGSSVREVTRLLRQAVEEHGRILKRPEPCVSFEDFGDNALIFEVSFYLSIRHILERRAVESDVRYRIEHLFREASVSMAYPQRDVHLNVRAPIEVRILDDARASREER